MFSVGFCTLGCRVNRYETDALSEEFVRQGFAVKSFEDKCDVYVINTCTVTSESDRKSRQMIRRARLFGGKDAIVMAVGCYTQLNEEKAIKTQCLDYIGGNTDKLHTVSVAKDLLLQRDNKRGIISNVKDIRHQTEIEQMKISTCSTTRSFVKISDGCNNRCSYCIIPKARGPVRSKSIDDAVCEVSALCNNGYIETVLTGIETAAYGKDLQGVTFCDLLENINNIKGLYRIRLGSLEPTVIRGDFADRIKNLEKVMPHFHLSLQSGSDSVLNAMRRRYNTQMFYEGISILREKIPNVTFTTDVIVGFPGETDEMFCDSMEFAEKCGFLYMHIFPYSKREGTEAADMKNQIDGIEKKKRVSAMEKVMRTSRLKVMKSFLNQSFEVLNESAQDGLIKGYTPNFIEVCAKGNCQQGKLCNVQLNDICDNLSYMSAELI